MKPLHYDSSHYFMQHAYTRLDQGIYFWNMELFSHELFLSMAPFIHSQHNSYKSLACSNIFTIMAILDEFMFTKQYAPNHSIEMDVWPDILKHHEDLAIAWKAICHSHISFPYRPGRQQHLTVHTRGKSANRCGSKISIAQGEETKESSTSKLKICHWCHTKTTKPWIKTKIPSGDNLSHDGSWMLAPWCSMISK